RDHERERAGKRPAQQEELVARSARVTHERQQVEIGVWPGDRILEAPRLDPRRQGREQRAKEDVGAVQPRQQDQRDASRGAHASRSHICFKRSGPTRAPKLLMSQISTLQYHAAPWFRIVTTFVTRVVPAASCSVMRSRISMSGRMPGPMRCVWSSSRSRPSWISVATVAHCSGLPLHWYCVVNGWPTRNSPVASMALILAFQRWKYSGRMMNGHTFAAGRAMTERSRRRI